MSTLTMRVLRVLVLLVLVGGSLASAASRAGAQGLSGDAYTDEEYGWSVEYDDGFWTGEEVDEPTYRGLNLSFEGGFGTLAVYEDGETDPADCLDATADDFAGSEIFVDFGPSRSLDAPETDRDAEGGIYTTTYTSDDVELPLVFYIECRELDGAALNIQLAANEDVYEDSLPAFEELLGAIETGGGSTRDETPEPEDEDTPEPEDDETPTTDLGETDLDAGLFVGGDYPVAVAWDPEVWTDAEAIEGTGREGVSLVAPAGGILQVFSQDTDPDYGADRCLQDNLDSWEAQSPDLDDFSPPRGQDIDWPRGAESAQAVGTITFDDETEATVVYSAACIELGDGEDYLIIALTSLEDGYEDNAVALNEVLAELQVGQAATEETPEPEEEETPENNGGENDVDAGELDDDTFTDTALDYTVTFDDRVWSGELLEGGATAGLFLTSDDELLATVTIDASVGYDGVDPEQCVEDLATGYGKFEGYSALDEVRNPDGPEAPRDGASAVYDFTFTAQDGTEIPLVAYIECRPIDDESMVRTTIQTTEDSLADNVDVFQEVLDGIEVDGGGASDDRGGDPTGPDDEETPETDEQEA